MSKNTQRLCERERERERKKKKERRMDGWMEKEKTTRFFPFFFVWLIITGEKERDFLLVEQLCATTNRFGID